MVVVAAVAAADFDGDAMPSSFFVGRLAQLQVWDFAL